VIAFALGLGLALAPAAPSGPLAIDAAIDKAVAWIDALEADPATLREKHGMRGKKHWNEKLFAYFVLATKEKDPARRAAFVARFEKALAPARAPAFHTFDDEDKKLFREEILSYVSAYDMAARLGLAFPEWRKSIAERVPAIAKDLPNRAIHWQMTFVHLLEGLGFDMPEKLDMIAAKGLVAERRGADALSAADIYGLVHEIFVLSDQGRREPRYPSDAARLYARALLPYLSARAVRENDVDLLAEILVAMRHAGVESHSAFEDGVRHLLTRQNPNGTFGTYERRRAELARAGSQFDVDAGAYLHTTAVAVWALAEAREVPFNTSSPSAPRPR